MFQNPETDGGEHNEINNDSSPAPGARNKPSIGLSLSTTGTDLLCTFVSVSVTDLSQQITSEYKNLLAAFPFKHFQNYLRIMSPSSLV